MNASSPIIYGFLMLLAGIGIPIMAALNGSLGSKVQSPIFATVVLFTVGGAVSIVYMSLTATLPKWSVIKHIPFYLFFAGFFVAFYILSITWVGPRFGIGNAVAFVLLGQLISMTVIDHLGLFDASQTLLTSQRALGLLLMTIGVFMVVRK